LQPSSKGQELFVVVVSLPNRLFVPSEAHYLALVEQDKKAGEGPTASRNDMAIYDPKHFQLVFANGEKSKGAYVGIWPAIFSEPGFSSRIISSGSMGADPHRRWAIAIAWDIDRTTIDGRVSVQFDQGDPVAVPDIRLTTDKNLVPSAVDLLSYRIEVAYNRVQKGAYVEAVAAAALVAEDSSANEDILYNAACVHALAIDRAEQDESLGGDERKTLSEKYAAEAVALLRQAISKGFHDLDHIQQDPDFANLRSRSDFQTLLLELEAKRKSPPAKNAEADATTP
jgi:hypothetical protein